MWPCLNMSKMALLVMKGTSREPGSGIIRSARCGETVAISDTASPSSVSRCLPGTYMIRASPLSTRLSASLRSNRTRALAMCRRAGPSTDAWDCIACSSAALRSCCGIPQVYPSSTRFAVGNPQVYVRSARKSRLPFRPVQCELACFSRCADASEIVDIMMLR
jgi:hypothetical protein